MSYYEEDRQAICVSHYCVACGAPCERRQDHEGQHTCINCGTRWWDDAEDDE